MTRAQWKDAGETALGIALGLSPIWLWILLAWLVSLAGV